MNLQNLAYIGELVAALGVVASLVYLGIQIKRNESTTRAATTQELLSKSIDMLLAQGNDSPIIKSAAGQTLTQVELANMDQLYFARFSHFNNAQHQNSVGKLDPEIWKMYDARTRRNVKQMPEFDRWWKQYQLNFTESFRQYIEKI